MIFWICSLNNETAVALCHLHSVPVVFEPVACSGLMFSGSSDHKCQENGGDHEGKEEQDRTVERIRHVIEPARDDCREGCKKCVGRNDRKVDGIPCPAVEV